MNHIDSFPIPIQLDISLLGLAVILILVVFRKTKLLPFWMMISSTLLLSLTALYRSILDWMKFDRSYLLICALIWALTVCLLSINFWDLLKIMIGKMRRKNYYT